MSKMNIAPHPRFVELFWVLKAAPNFTPWAGVLFRTSAPKYAAPPYVLTGLGAVMNGGRWNPPMLFPAIYFGADAKTTAAEADQDADLNEWSLPHLTPQTRVTFQVTLNRVLDLTKSENLRALKVSRTDLVNYNWRIQYKRGREALTQAIARAAFENMAEGLLVPSARRSGGLNLVHFPTNRIATSSVETLHAGQIPLVHGLE